jgi:hypothetical protein
VDVSPFSTKYDKMKSIEVVQAGTAWDDPTNGITYIPILNEVLDLTRKLNKSLLNPNQKRSNGVTVEDCPTQFDGSSLHSIFFSKEDIRFPLSLNVIISYVETRVPTERELADCLWLQLTSDTKWDPYSHDFAQQEEQVSLEKGNYLDPDLAR